MSSKIKNFLKELLLSFVIGIGMVLLYQIGIFLGNLL